MSDLKKVTVVTSFSEKGWNDYAEQMIWTAAGHWEPSIKLIAYYHDFDINTKNLPNNKNIMVLLLKRPDITGAWMQLSFVIKYLP